MSKASIARINEAIKSCLIACYESELPLARIKQFLDALYADPEFNEKEVLIVSDRVRSMLSMMFKRSDGGPLLPVIPTAPEDQANDHDSHPLEEKGVEKSFAKPVEKSVILSANDPSSSPSAESQLPKARRISDLLERDAFIHASEPPR